MEERELTISAALETVAENQRKVDTLAAEVDEATKATLNTEEKVAEVEATLARLMGEQASLRLDYLNLKRVELEKSSQLREARVVLKEAEDQSRKAQIELMITLRGRTPVTRQTRRALSPVSGTATEVAPATEVAKATEVVPATEVAKATEVAPATAAATVAEVTGAEGTTTAEAVPPKGAASNKFPYPSSDTR